MSTRITIDVEVGVDVPGDVIGIWIMQKLNHWKAPGSESDSIKPHLDTLDNYDGPIAVTWRERQDEGRA